MPGVIAECACVCVCVFSAVPCPWVTAASTSFFCAAGDYELSLNRATTITTNALIFSATVSSGSSSCWSFYYLPGQRLIISMTTDQPIGWKMNTATTSQDDSSYCPTSVGPTLPVCANIDSPACQLLNFSTPCQPDPTASWFTYATGGYSYMSVFPTTTSNINFQVKGVCVCAFCHVSVSVCSFLSQFCALCCSC